MKGMLSNCLGKIIEISGFCGKFSSNSIQYLLYIHSTINNVIQCGEN